MAEKGKVNAEEERAAKAGRRNREILENTDESTIKAAIAGDESKTPEEIERDRLCTKAYIQAGYEEACKRYEERLIKRGTQ